MGIAREPLSSLEKEQVPSLGVLQNKYLLSSQLLLPPPVVVKQHELKDYNHLLPLFIINGVCHV
jgi:hypothetical protein